MPRPKLFIVEGAVIGYLTVGEICRDRTKAPDGTPGSYLSMGEVRWCSCECGRKVIYPTVLLEKNNILSCGCYKARVRAWKAAERERVTERKELRQELKGYQKELTFAQHSRDYKKADELGKAIRKILTRIAESKLQSAASASE